MISIISAFKVLRFALTYSDEVDSVWITSALDSLEKEVDELVIERDLLLEHVAQLTKELGDVYMPRDKVCSPTVKKEQL